MHCAVDRLISRYLDLLFSAGLTLDPQGKTVLRIRHDTQAIRECFEDELELANLPKTIASQMVRHGVLSFFSKSIKGKDIWI